ncbi:MAG TPA: ParB/RepB/Spo0J family partition protein [Syntrophales bacterium]|nr:ParB/RepB/Spo0J family partition protein [Syntrophales bacterium]HOL58328.1 ParB/RepB/Spo0J family partition protein [Syntrophales bacterium]HPO34497.1 ParB/RepB/Spo0J family partition protein [Syntrophales bacterium]
MKQKAPLGKGLSALFPELEVSLEGRSTYRTCGIEELVPNRFQPRRDFPEEEQRELIQSIKDKGIVQPIIVRKIDGAYEIIAGERRWRAAQKAGLKEVPIVVRSATDAEVAEISLIENLQRTDLNPIEEAQAYQTLIERFGFHQEEIASRIGKDRSTVANALRLLRLPEGVKKALIEKRISPGHARALLALEATENILQAFKEVISRDLSVRETEALVRRFMQQKKANRVTKDPLLTEYEREASSILGTPVKIRVGKRGGQIEIKFASPEELNRLLNRIINRYE